MDQSDPDPQILFDFLAYREAHGIGVVEDDRHEAMIQRRDTQAKMHTLSLANRMPSKG